MPEWHGALYRWSICKHLVYERECVWENSSEMDSWYKKSEPFSVLSVSSWLSWIETIRDSSFLSVIAIQLHFANTSLCSMVVLIVVNTIAQFPVLDSNCRPMHKGFHRKRGMYVIYVIDISLTVDWSLFYHQTTAVPYFLCKQNIFALTLKALNWWKMCFYCLL